MDYIYSKHFLERIVQRSLSEADITAILFDEVMTTELNSKTDDDVVLKLGKISEKGIAVIYNRKTGVLITARRMQKREENIYKERDSHGFSL